MYVILWFADLPNFEFWSMNICYCLFSAPQNQFKAEKKIVLWVSVLLFDQ